MKRLIKNSKILTALVLTLTLTLGGAMTVYACEPPTHYTQDVILWYNGAPSYLLNTSLQNTYDSYVYKVQCALDQLGYAPGPLDGHYGPQTDLAVRAYQYDHNLATDGMVGSQTWNSIRSH